MKEHGAATTARSAVEEKPAVDQQRLEALLGRVVGDFGATASAGLAVIGDKLGLYKAIAGGGDPLGTIATERALRDVVTSGGLTQFRRVLDTPFNRIFEARI